MKRAISCFCYLLIFAVSCAEADTATSFVAEHKSFFQLLSPDETDFRMGYTYQPTTKEDGGPGEFSLHQFFGDLEIARPLNEDFYLRLGANYEARLYNFDSQPGARINLSSETLHKIVARVGAGLFLTDDLLLTGVALPGIWSDFDGSIKEDDTDLQGDSALIYRINPGTELLVGLAYNEVYDDVPLLPYGGIRLLSSSGRLSARVTFPLEAEVGYKLDLRSKVYGGYWIRGDEYRVADEDEDFDLHLQDRRLGAGFMYWFSERLNFRIEGGATHGSEMTIKVRDAGQFEDGDLDTTGYLTAALGASF